MDRINIGNNEEIKKDNKSSNTNNLNELTDEEKLKAKENGFILLGKTGVGKTSILNVIYKANIGKVGHSLQSETKTSTQKASEVNFTHNCKVIAVKNEAAATKK